MRRVALAGNPNSGKTTLFNRLTGLNQRVGNYPGITVDRREGRGRLGERELEVIDLPGAYSLLAQSEDERISFDTLRHEPIDAVIAVLDSNVLSRGLSYVLSLQEQGRPVVVVLNMQDELERAGHAIDPAALESELSSPVAPMVAKRGIGFEHLEDALGRLPERPVERAYRATEEHEAAIRELRERAGVSDGEALWLIGSVASGLVPASDAEKEAASQLELHPDLAADIIRARQLYASALADRVLRRNPNEEPTLTDKIDHWALHPVFGTLTFAAVMFALFQSIFAWADPLVGLIESGVGTTQAWVRGAFGDGALVDLLADGVVGGVGNVVVFVPQIAFLFLFIAVLEDSGYLSRVALMSDRLMAAAGLHGRAFVPLLSGFACAVPAIMATRTIENPRDRLVTILVTPLMSCSARLPVYALLIGALFAADRSVFGVFSLGGVMLFALYLFSTLLAVFAAFVLKRLVLKGPTPALTLELPPYRIPQGTSVLRRVLQRCGVFIKEAGTVILAISIVLWALLYFPRPEPGTPDTVAIEQSIGGQIGHAIEPVIEPLGYNWQLGVGLLASFAAREVFVATMALVHGQDPGVDPEDPGLRATLQNVRDPSTGAKVYTPLVGLSLMVFFLVAMQCMSTLAVIKRETGGWRWPVFALVYMNALAWVLAFAVYQGGRLLGYA